MKGLSNIMCSSRASHFCQNLIRPSRSHAKCASCWTRRNLNLHMNKLKHLSVGTQVLFTFGTLCAILLIIGGLFFFSLRSIERSNQLQQSRALNKLALIDDTAQDVGQLQAEALRQVLASDM